MNRETQLGSEPDDEKPSSGEPIGPQVGDEAERTSEVLPPTSSQIGSGGDSLGELLGLDKQVEDRGRPDPLIGVTLGDVRIVRLIGQGGMGRVYEGFQERLGRVVAVKVMRPGFVTPEMQYRFKVEAEILARLQHPGIAQIYAAGMHDLDGASVPYFVMELIAGARPLTRYAEEMKLSTKDRLTLFQSVCDAVAHGHQKGVIHRDLKPSNILVDAHGQPKVIDFGVAKATNSDLALTTMRTEVGQIIGTLQYMAPEQIEGNPADIDVRCDVYALGIVLYELLTGRLPYDVRNKAIHEAMRMVREAEPLPMSSFDRMLRGDLAVIAAKCLEKDRGSRYAAASEVGDDLSRHLAGEPIKAKPPGCWRSVQRLAKKHRAMVSAITAAGLTVMVIGLRPQPQPQPQPNRLPSLAVRDPALRWSSDRPVAAISLGTIVTDQELLISKKDLLAAIRRECPSAIDIENLELTQGEGTLVPQEETTWHFCPQQGWSGEAVFSYSIVTQGQGGPRMIRGRDRTANVRMALNGSARLEPRGLVLTAAEPHQVGSSFFASKFDLTRDFSAAFLLQISGGTGGDGMTFLLQDDARGISTIGGVGGGLGFYGIKKSLAVEFDTCLGIHPADVQVGADHVGIMINGEEAIDWQADPGFDLQSGIVHAWVEYSARSSKLDVYVAADDSRPKKPVFSVIRNLAASIGSDAYVGFSGATGTLSDRHVVIDWDVEGFLSGKEIGPGRASLNVRPARRVTRGPGHLPRFPGASQIPESLECPHRGPSLVATDERQRFAHPPEPLRVARSGGGPDHPKRL